MPNSNIDTIMTPGTLVSPPLPSARPHRIKVRSYRFADKAAARAAYRRLYVHDLHAIGGIEATVDAVDRCGRQLLSAIQWSVHVPVAEVRADGLCAETARRTARYMIHSLGAEVVERDESNTVVAGGSHDVIDAIQKACLMHGWTTRRSGVDARRGLVEIDVTTCEAGATPEERRSRAEELAGDDDNDYACCMQQTITFLRQRAGVS